MYSYFVLIVCSIFLARYFEKHYRVATIAHAILFIVASFIHLFCSDVSFTVYAMKNIFGEHYYGLIRSVFVENVYIFNISFSALFAVEIASYITVSVLAIIALIKGFKKLVKFFQVKKNNPIVTNLFNLINNLYPSRVQIDEKRKTYLILGKLLN